MTTSGERLELEGEWDLEVTFGVLAERFSVGAMFALRLGGGKRTGLREATVVSVARYLYTAMRNVSVRRT